MSLNQSIETKLKEYALTITDDNEKKEYILNTAESSGVVQLIAERFWNHYAGNPEAIYLDAWIRRYIDFTWELIVLNKE